jgi:methylenetetrahydrofolate dehydrogenase (NADP+) / methenyltetrahydrofolate cyclohydrolase
MAGIINGRKIAREIRRELTQHIQDEKINVGLAAVLVGDNPASETYVHLKEQAAEKVGIKFIRVALPITASTEEVLKSVNDLNSNSGIDGIIVQLPLPKQVDTDAVISAIDPKKDADGFLPNSSVLPVMAQVVETLIASVGDNLEGKKALIIANTPDIFAPPVAELLNNKHGSISESTKPDDPELLSKTKDADIIIIAIGRAHFLKPEMIKTGSILIDIGITKTPEGILGDVDPSTDSVAAWRSRVPGGVGPVTVATLLKNAVQLAQL